MLDGVDCNVPTPAPTQTRAMPRGIAPKHRKNADDDDDDDDGVGRRARRQRLGDRSLSATSGSLEVDTDRLLADIDSYQASIIAKSVSPPSSRSASLSHREPTKRNPLVSMPSLSHFVALQADNDNNDDDDDDDDDDIGDDEELDDLLDTLPQDISGQRYASMMLPQAQLQRALRAEGARQSSLSRSTSARPRSVGFQRQELSDRLAAASNALRGGGALSSSAASSCSTVASRRPVRRTPLSMAASQPSIVRGGRANTTAAVSPAHRLAQSLRPRANTIQPLYLSRFADIVVTVLPVRMGSAVSGSVLRSIRQMDTNALLALGNMNPGSVVLSSTSHSHRQLPVDDCGALVALGAELAAAADAVRADETLSRGLAALCGAGAEFAKMTWRMFCAVERCTRDELAALLKHFIETLKELGQAASARAGVTDAIHRLGNSCYFQTLSLQRHVASWMLNNRNAIALGMLCVHLQTLTMGYVLASARIAGAAASQAHVDYAAEALRQIAVALQEFRKVSSDDGNDVGGGGALRRIELLDNIDVLALLRKQIESVPPQWPDAAASQLEAKVAVDAQELLRRIATLPTPCEFDALVNVVRGAKKLLAALLHVGAAQQRAANSQAPVDADGLQQLGVIDRMRRGIFVRSTEALYMYATAIELLAAVVVLGEPVPRDIATSILDSYTWALASLVIATVNATLGTPTEWFFWLSK
jgi:hypothetical protein